ncbi:MAG: DUF6575 domain-containing protein [Anaerolineales bacterium]
METLKIRPDFFETMTISEVLDFVELPYLYTLEDAGGLIYLSYLDRFVDAYTERRFAIQISETRLANIKCGKISIGEVFRNPENDFVFILHVDETDGTTTLLDQLTNDVFQKQFGAVRNDYFLHQEGEPELDNALSTTAIMLAKYLASTSLPKQNKDGFSVRYRTTSNLYTEVNYA